MRPRLLTLFLASAAVLIAGCATPEETRNGGAANETAYVSIDGELYRCDDTLDVDGVCDEYELADDAPDGAEARASFDSADGRVTIDGRDFVCDDTRNVAVGDEASTVGKCEKYVLAADE